MTTITEHLEQENEALKRQVDDLQRELTATRRQAADRNAELARENLETQKALDQVCARLAAAQEARRELARDLGQTNAQLTGARETIQHLKVVRLKAQLLLIATEEGTDIQVVDAARDLRKLLEGRTR